MMAENIKGEYLPLTLRNVVKAVKKVRKWRYLGRWLGVKCSLLYDSLIRSKLERRYSSTADRRTGVIEYWLHTDPAPSWRRLILALDGMGEHEVADMVRPYAEPITDSTLTLENVTRVIASVVEWDSLGCWIGVPKPKLDQISEQYADKGQRMAAMVREWLESSPNASWALLAEALYCEEEETALEEVKRYLQKQQDPTLTVTNLWNVLKGVRCWFADGIGLTECFPIPSSKHWEIEHYGEYHMEDFPEYDRNQYFVEYWLTTHPAPSWMVVAQVLYRHGREDALQVLEVVRRKYLTDTTLYGLCLQHIVDDYEYFSPLVHHLPSPVQRWIIQRWKIHCRSDTEYWKLVTAEKRTEEEESGEEVDLSKYDLVEDSGDEDGDLSKYDLSSDTGSESKKTGGSPDRRKRSRYSRSRSRSRSPRRRQSRASRLRSRSRDRRKRSYSRSRSRGRSRSKSHDRRRSRSRSRDRRSSSRSQSRSRGRRRRQSHSRSRSWSRDKSRRSRSHDRSKDRRWSHRSRTRSRDCDRHR